MSDLFNPYHQWLDIPLDEQPADHYRLLGLKRFEMNREVISHAADLRIARIKSYISGEHRDDAERLLGEIAKAVGCLLNPSRRAIYDQDLRSAEVASQHGRAMLPPTPAELAAQSRRTRKSVQPPPRPNARARRLRAALISLLISGAVMAVVLGASFMYMAQSR